MKTNLQLFPVFLALSRVIAIAKGDWSSSWEASRTLDRSGEVDPRDSRSSMRGGGSITIGNGIAVAKGRKPRLYISSSSKWDNVDMSAYGKFVNKGSLKNYSGFTMVARTNHDKYSSNGCEAFGYYARIYWTTGEIAFQKEYYHSGSDIVYTPSKRKDYFDGGVPMNRWIGMRFTVVTEGDEVKLKLYLDEAGDGSWVLRHSMTDRPGEWETGGNIPSSCPQENGDPVVRPGNVCFLRSDGSDSTEMHWKDARILDLVDGPPPNNSVWCRDGTIDSSGQYCCGGCGGQCGGSGCSGRPGGASQCCTSGIADSGVTCSDPSQSVCIIPQPTAALWCQDGTIDSSGQYCCGGCGGQCGGSGCSSRPGGASQCCTSGIGDSGVTCSDPSQVACIIPVGGPRIDGFCNWGPDGTGSTSTCSGGAQGGSWCNENQSQCENGCGGNWCS